ncbi:MAG: NAD-dependent DNA ligase LigA [Clostridiales bacterium]|nr:NAD-dependent DNA ligase LigA [Clostridiales bacterium]
MELSKIKELVEKLNYYTKLYDEGRPEISDKEWDDMYFELQKIERESGIYLEDSPTQRVNFQVVNKLNKIEHNHPMLSLDKTKDINEVQKFIYYNDYIAMAKMDGLTCSLKYVNGKLVSAETRGNGFIGEDILHNALQVKNIPKRINFKDELIVDGEIICTYENFKEFESEYKNPRNFASGSIRLLDSKESSMRRLSFIAWDCISGLEEVEKLSTKLLKLNILGFTVVPFMAGEYSIDDTISTIQSIAQEAGYPIDGIVYKYDIISEYEAAGKTDHHFKGGLAYKFYDEEYETILRDVEWTMGRTGVLTPVALLEPINIDGSEVSRASLHNISIMDELGIRYQDTKVMVYKANMIIPQISKALPYEEEIASLINIPAVCPICGEPTIIKGENGVRVLYCSNPNCEGKLINRLDHFFGKKGLDAKGLSKATFEKLIDWGWIENIKDVFKLKEHKKEWEKMQGFGEKSVEKILQAIEDCKSCSLDAVISAAGIPLIGKTVGKDLSKRFGSYSEFREAVESGFDFTSFGGYGWEMHKAISDFDYSELDYIVDNYLQIKENIKEDNELKLKDLTFCVTGKVHIWKNRDSLSAFIESLGGKVTGSVSKNTNYLINNDINSTSAKNKKAQELDIPILSEEDFKKIFDIN